MTPCRPLSTRRWRRLDFEPVLTALDALPRRVSSRLEDRLHEARHALSAALSDLWKTWQAAVRFRSPLLVFDEAHHLKNWTRLSSLFAEEGAAEDSDAVSRGPLAGVFSRMLFLTATPFQLGHRELISVLGRFTGMAWDSPGCPTGREGALHTRDGHPRGEPRRGPGHSASSRISVGAPQAGSSVRR